VASNKSISLAKQDSKKNQIMALVAILLALYVAWRLNSSLQYLDPSEDRLKDVFFGREPWLVLCNDGSTSVDSVFEGTSRKEKGVSFGVLDCAKQLPSKKTTLERLKLNPNVAGPVLFFAGYGRDPKQLPAKLLRDQYTLRRELTALTKMHAAKVKDSNTLYRKCLKKGKCGLVLAGAPLEGAALATLNAASDASSDVSWVVVDGTKLKLRKPSEKDLGLRKYEPGAHRVLLLQPAQTALGAPAMLNAQPYDGPFAESALTAFLETMSGRSEFEATVDPEVRAARVLVLFRFASFYFLFKFPPFVQSLALMKRKAPSPQYRAPAASPTSNEQATILPTQVQEEQKAALELRRLQREVDARRRMDAEAEGFIEYEGESEDDEDEDEEEAEGNDEESDEEDMLDLD